MEKADDYVKRLRERFLKLSKQYDKHRTTIHAGLLALAFVVFSTAIYLSGVQDYTSSKVNALPAIPAYQPNLKYGFDLNRYHVTNDTIANNQFLADILLKHKVSFLEIDQLARNAKDSFDVRGLRANKPYTILTKDTCEAVDYFIYEPNVFGYVVFDIKNKTAREVKHPIVTTVKTGSGIIESSLWNAMTDNGMSFELAARMEDALAWSIDFHHVLKGDRFKLVYEEQSIDGQPVGVGAVIGAYYNNQGNEYYAVYFENDRHGGFYDLEARPMKKAFLKAPVKYTRISSRYNLRRFHPVLKRTRPHYGTDYAAPTGTPIYAVADGVVTKRHYTRGNGKYIKIKHDNVYQTQYLHMSRFAKGVNVGSHVKQGQTIGYVGQTGLANGPHVCFRFWKNGKQVNHLRENLPPPEPMPASDISKFNTVKEEVKQQLDAIPFKEKPVEEVVEKVEETEEKSVMVEQEPAATRG